MREAQFPSYFKGCVVIGRFKLGAMAQNLLATAGVQIMVATLAIVSGPLQARGLGPDGRGQLAVVLILGQITAYLSDGGTLGFLIKERARGKNSGELIGSIFPIACGALAIAAILAYPVSLIFSNGVGLLQILILCQLATLPLSACTQIGSALALGDERWKVMVAIRLITAVVPFLGLAILFVNGNMSLTSACVCYFASTAIAALPAIRLIKAAAPYSFQKVTMNQAWAFGKVSIITILITFSNARSDILLASQLLPFSQLGIYAVSCSLASLPTMLVNAASQSLSKRLSMSDFGLETARISRIIIFGVAVACCGLAIIAPIVVPIFFGADFANSSTILIVLLIGTVAAAPSNFLGYASSVAGYPKRAAIAQVAGVAVMLVMILSLSSTLGVTGVAIANVSGYIISAAILLICGSRSTGVPWHNYVMITRNDLAHFKATLIRPSPNQEG